MHVENWKRQLLTFSMWTPDRVFPASAVKSAQNPDDPKLIQVAMIPISDGSSEAR